MTCQMMDLFGYLPYSGNAQRRAERKRHIPRRHMTAGPDQEDFLGVGGDKSHRKDSRFNRLGGGGNRALTRSPAELIGFLTLKVY